VTRYAYQGNSTTVTDPAGKWKTFTTDAFGNLTVVTEPRPGGGTNYLTNYTYNGANQLTNVQLVRDGYTQPRTFQWSGTDLVSATNPENGTVTYTYDGAHHVLTRTDAKGQGTGYSYDAYGRLTAVAHYPQGFANAADTNQQITYYYDTNPYNDPIANYTWGRLAAVAFGNACGNSGAAYIYMYGYNPAGRVSGQKMRVSVNNTFPGSNTCGYYTATDQTATYGWDTEGRMTSLTYPGSTNVLAYTYDAMGHLTGMTDSITGATTASATYGTAGEIDSLAYGSLNGGFAQTFTYNSLWQLTGDGTTQYVYPAGQNNGRISQSFDGVQTVNYTYDSLNRLATAQATDSSWGQAYSYDGFGNLTAKTVTAGSGPHFSTSYPNGGVAGTDANGNVLAGPLDPATGNWVVYTYDVENRIITSCEPSGGICNGLYGYDPQGKRVLRQTALPAPSGNWAINWEFTFYGITGQRLSAFNVVTSAYQNSGYCNGARACTNGPAFGYVYFGGKLLWGSNGTPVLTDRLGSRRNGVSYYPWGEEKTTTPDGQVKFGTYFRDMAGQDYADQRYYTATAGRFYTPDPSTGVNLGNPITWNKYAYASDDPVNRIDPAGLFDRWGDDPYGDDSGWFPDIGWFGGGAHSIVLDWTAIARGNCDDGQWQTAFRGIGPCIQAGVAVLAAAAQAAAAQAQQPVQCQFNGVTMGKPGFRTGPNIGYGYDMPIYFNFTATGGDGIYNWDDKQQFSEVGSVIYKGSNIPVAVNASGYESLTNYGTPNSTSPSVANSRNASFYDAPGQASVDPAFGKTVSAVLSWTFTLNVHVDGVSCGSVSWGASLMWPRRGRPVGKDFLTP